MKIIVTGSRTFNDYFLSNLKLDFYLCNQNEVEIVSALAGRADSFGEIYALN